MNALYREENVRAMIVCKKGGGESVSNEIINLEYLQPSSARHLDDGYYRDCVVYRNYNVQGIETVSEKVHLHRTAIYCKTCVTTCNKCV